MCYTYTKGHTNFQHTNTLVTYRVVYMIFATTLALRILKLTHSEKVLANLTMNTHCTYIHTNDEKIVHVYTALVNGK